MIYLINLLNAVLTKWFGSGYYGNNFEKLENIARCRRLIARNYR